MPEYEACHGFLNMLDASMGLAPGDPVRMADITSYTSRASRKTVLDFLEPSYGIIMPEKHIKSGISWRNACRISGQGAKNGGFPE